MTYATAKLEQSSEKYTLVRISCRKNINEDVVSLGGNLYKCSNIFEDVYDFYENDGQYNQVDVTPSSPQEFMFDKSTGELTFYSTNAPSNSRVFIAEFYMYFSSGVDQYIGKDPKDSPLVDLRHWQARIKTTPVLTQTIENITEGILSVSISGMSLVNEDEFFDKYLGYKYSFLDMEVSAWHIIGDSSNINLSFVGYITEISKSIGSIDLTLADIFEKFNRKCILGNVLDIGEDRSTYTGIQPSKKETPFKLYFGRDSSFGTIEHVQVGVSSYGPFRQIDPNECDSAICWNYNPFLATNTNRNYVLGFVLSSGPQNISSTITATNFSGNYCRLTMSASDVDKYSIGDTLKLNTNTGDYWYQVLSVDYNSGYIYIAQNAGLFTTANSIYNSLVTRLDLIIGNAVYWLTEGTHFTTGSDPFSINTTTIYSVKVTLINNLEAALGLTDPINPEEIQLKFKIKPPRNNANHSDILKFLVQELNISINTSSFTTAKSDLDANVIFSIPEKNNNSHQTYLEIIQKLLQSTLGHIYLDSDFFIGYKLFSQPTGGEIIDKDDILDGSFSVSFDYDDLETKIVAFNNGTDRFDPLNYSTTDGELQNNKFFYKKNLSYFELDHFLEDISLRFDEILSLKSNRKILISFSSVSKLFDAKIGDNLILRRSKLPDDETEMNVKIISLIKTPNRVDVVVTDLFGL